MKARRGLRTGKKNKRRAEHRRRDGRELETAETEREEIQKKQRAHRDTQHKIFPIHHLNSSIPSF